MYTITSLTKPLCTEVPKPGERDVMYMCVRSVDSVSISTMFRLEFGSSDGVIFFGVLSSSTIHFACLFG